jgi:protein subunit release factor B
MLAASSRICARQGAVVFASLSVCAARLSTSWAGAGKPPFFEEADITEKFAKGWGCGGQGVNKSSNAVILTHAPSGQQVRCHKHRSLSDNRKEARLVLKLRLDTVLHGQESKLLKKQARKRRSKSQAARRARDKYGDTDTPISEPASAPARPEAAVSEPEPSRKRVSHAEKVKQQLQHLVG